MRTLGLALITFSFIHGRIALAQSIAVVAKAGISSYGAVNIGSFGGDGGDTHWKKGPIVSLGARLRTSDRFAVDAAVEYSWHRYDPGMWDIPVVNDPKNRILDLVAAARLSFPIFNLFDINIIGGPELSYQNKDGLVQVYGSYRNVGTGRKAIDLGAALGIGVEVELSKMVEVWLEGSWRMRFYVTPVAQLGVAYTL
jgi:opacity protein-like surface antigen